MVVDGGSRIDIVECDCNLKHAEMACDGQGQFSLMVGDQVVVR